jgi:hypothetical protein
VGGAWVGYTDENAVDSTVGGNNGAEDGEEPPEQHEPDGDW